MALSHCTLSRNNVAVAKATAPPPANPFQLKKKFGGGKSQKKAKGAAGGARPAPLDRRRGSELAFCAKMGSSFGIQSHQNGTFRDLVARQGGFFSGGAQRLPVRFQGGDKKLPCLRHGSFCFGRQLSTRSASSHRGMSCIIVSATQFNRKRLYFLAQIAVLEQFGLFRIVLHQDGFLS